MIKVSAITVCLVAASSGALAQDYSGLRVVERAVIEKMPSGPGLTGTILSPDGERLIHVDGREVCLFDVKSAGAWTKVGCARGHEELSFAQTEEFRWSPDSTAVLFPTYANVFVRLRDADVGIFDATTQTVQLLTGDGIIKIADDTVGFADLAAQWVDSDTIVFVRYPLAGKRLLGHPIQLMTIERDGTGMAVLAEFDRETYGLIDALAVSPDGGEVAFHVYSKDGTKSGVWRQAIGEKDDTGPRWELYLPDMVRLVAGDALPGPVQGLAYSPDGEKLLMISSTEGYPAATVLDLGTGETVPVSPGDIGGVGWSPSGHALIYTAVDPKREGKDVGVYVAPEPGQPAYRILEGQYYEAACCSMHPIPWAANDRLLFQSIDEIGAAVSVQLGR